jgi:hypothetical protein
MQLDYAILASGAESASRNRVHILGANISNWQSATFPVDAILAFVAKLDFNAGEFNQTHQYRIELGCADATLWQRLTPDYEFTSVENTARPEVGSSMTIMANVNARLPEPGDYVIRLLVDEVEVARRPLYAIRLQTPAGATR